jgi:hypothetical protein
VLDMRSEDQQALGSSRGRRQSRCLHRGRVGGERMLRLGRPAGGRCPRNPLIALVEQAEPSACRSSESASTDTNVALSQGGAAVCPGSRREGAHTLRRCWMECSPGLSSLPRAGQPASGPLASAGRRPDRRGYGSGPVHSWEHVPVRAAGSGGPDCECDTRSVISVAPCHLPDAALGTCSHAFFREQLADHVLGLLVVSPMCEYRITPLSTR